MGEFFTSIKNLFSKKEAAKGEQASAKVGDVTPEADVAVKDITTLPKEPELSESQMESIKEYLRVVCGKGFPLGAGLWGNFNSQRVDQYQPVGCISELLNTFIIPDAGKVKIQVEQPSSNPDDARKTYYPVEVERSVWKDTPDNPSIVVISDQYEVAVGGLPKELFIRTYVLATRDTRDKLLQL